MSSSASDEEVKATMDKLFSTLNTNLGNNFNPEIEGNSEYYDDEELFDTQMMPLIKQLLALSRTHDIPFLCYTQFMNAKKNSGKAFAMYASTKRVPGRMLLMREIAEAGGKQNRRDAE